MNAKDIEKLLAAEDRKRPLETRCAFCETQLKDARLYPSRGCRFCRKDCAEMTVLGMARLSKGIPYREVTWDANGTKVEGEWKS